jgi:hypothetical protein
MQLYDRGERGGWFEREFEIKNERCESQCITLLNKKGKFGRGRKVYRTNNFFSLYI